MKSMTGFGAATVPLGAGGGEIAVEAKSVNQRFLDLKLSLPREYAAFEAEVRKLVQERVARGRVEVWVSRSVPGAERARVQIDEEVARAYVAEWNRVKRALDLAGDVDLSFLRGLPDLFRPREAASVAAEEERPLLDRALDEALRDLDAARSREGKHLERDMRSRIAHLDALAEEMSGRAVASVADVERRLRERMQELLGQAGDEARIVQEAAFLAERGDVTEEIVRLRAHLAGLVALFGATEPVGKKIEFLLQEVGREVNTVASKSADLRLTQLAVEAKAEVEKIREQVQNVE